jgi:hypothetical protein
LALGRAGGPMALVSAIEADVASGFSANESGAFSTHHVEDSPMVSRP